MTLAPRELLGSTLWVWWIDDPILRTGEYYDALLCEPDGEQGEHGGDPQGLFSL